MVGILLSGPPQQPARGQELTPCPYRFALSLRKTCFVGVAQNRVTLFLVAIG